MSDQRSSWAIGWTLFAGVMMFLMSMWWIVVGLVGVATDTFLVSTQHYIFQFDVSTWGWIHFAIGILVLFASIFLFIGAVWARTVGVIIAGLAALAAFAWLPYYPAWAILLIAVAVAVISSLTAHGRDIIGD